MILHIINCDVIGQKIELIVNEHNHLKQGDVKGGLQRRKFLD